MNSFSAYAMGAANRHKELMVFDWIKAAAVIKERNAKYASAGLQGDWEYTSGDILADGKPVPSEDTYTFLSSTWATPELIVDGEVVECYKMKSETPDWDSGTYWPQEALDILNGEL